MTYKPVQERTCEHVGYYNMDSLFHQNLVLQQQILANGLLLFLSHCSVKKQGIDGSLLYKTKLITSV